MFGTFEVVAWQDEDTDWTQHTCSCAGDVTVVTQPLPPPSRTVHLSQTHNGMRNRECSDRSLPQHSTSVLTSSSLYARLSPRTRSSRYHITHPTRIIRHISTTLHLYTQKWCDSHLRHGAHRRHARMHSNTATPASPKHPNTPKHTPAHARLSPITHASPSPPLRHATLRCTAPPVSAAATPASSDTVRIQFRKHPRSQRRRQPTPAHATPRHPMPRYAAGPSPPLRCSLPYTAIRCAPGGTLGCVAASAAAKWRPATHVAPWGGGRG